MYTDFKEYSELYHYGILGMKWGVRRFQNKDGTLTGAGKERYDVGDKRDTSKDKILDSNDIWDVGNAASINRVIDRYDYNVNKYDEYTNNITNSQSYSDALDFMHKSERSLDRAMDDYIAYDKYTTNCPNCALAVELKKRGVDVRAVPNSGGQTIQEIHDIYVGEKTTTCYRNRDFFNPKSYGKPGDHGTLLGYYPNGMGGHICNYTVLPNGRVQIEDAQVGICCYLEDYQKLYPGMGVNEFVQGEIVNLTKAEIDMELAKQKNMVEKTGKGDSNQQKRAEVASDRYEKKVQEYVKKKKKAEKWLKKILGKIINFKNF